jgi:hypothetical protein
MKDKINSLFSSRRFLAACAAVVVVCCDELIGISPDQTNAILGVVIAWIIGDSIQKT